MVFHRLGLLFLIGLTGAVTITAQPSLQVVGGTKLDLGSIYRGDVVERTVAIKNTGIDTLLLRGVQASCGCTGTILSDNRVAPGQTTSLRITFNSQNFRGPVHKSVTVYTNDPTSPAATIDFTATILQEIVLEPQHFWFKDAEVGRSTKFSIRLQNSSEHPLRLKAFRTELVGLTLVLPEEEIAPGGEVQLTAEFTPRSATRTVSNAVTITTSSARQKELYIPVFGNVREFRFDERATGDQGLR